MDTGLRCQILSSSITRGKLPPPLAMDVFALLAVCVVVSVDISGSIGTASAFVNNTPIIIKRVSLSKFERFATNINFEKEDDINVHQHNNKQSNVFTSRRSFISSSITIASSILYPNFNANADDLHYKSKSDGDEDPLVVFGKSLENMGNDSTNSSGSSSNDASSLSFSDISLPQSTDDSIASPPQDLNKALKEKSESQKRSVDPRTHG